MNTHQHPRPTPPRRAPRAPKAAKAPAPAPAPDTKPRPRCLSVSRQTWPIDPAGQGLELLRGQVLFLTACREDPTLAPLAPRFGIDPIFWGPGCAAEAFREALKDNGRD